MKHLLNNSSSAENSKLVKALEHINVPHARLIAPGKKATQLFREWCAKILIGFDRPLALIVFLLMALGLMVLASASVDVPTRIQDQLRNIVLTFILMWALSMLPTQTLMRFAVPLYSVGITLLIAVALFGITKKGARRWLNVGLVIQPSEIMKIAMPLMLAWYFQKRELFIRWFDYVVALLLVALPVGLIAKQPDLGTALLVAAAGFYVIFLAGFSWKLIVPFFTLCVVCVGLILGFQTRLCDPDLNWPLLHDYQKHRVCTLIDPGSDPLGKGFHTIQSTIAIGSGGITGKGWFKGTQAHLDFIPEKHTDFIFAVFAEEFGLIGEIILLVLYLMLFWRGFMISASGATQFSRLISGAVTLIFFTYVFVNMGMVSGILPVVGVPLPFISYGGTALATLGLGIGILMSVAREKRLMQS